MIRFSKSFVIIESATNSKLLEITSDSQKRQVPMTWRKSILYDEIAV
jgi:hypothetical protein